MKRLSAIFVLLMASLASAQLSATAYLIPKETAPEGEGYFAIVEGHNRRLYIGTHANAVNSYLVEFDPATAAMKAVVDAQKAIGTDATGFAAQAKIHTRCHVGESGKIYFATKQGYPAKDEPRTKYPGGYPMAYDPATGKTQVWPIAVKHQGIISIMPDESRGVAYISTCSDQRPESSHFLILDLKASQYRDLGETNHVYAFIVLDHLGRAYHPLLGGDILRWDPTAQKLERLKQTIDGQPPAADSLFRHPQSHKINWEVSPDRKTLYAVPMSGNQLYAYDLTAPGDTLPGRSLGPLIAGAEKTDCRGLCVGPTGDVWATVTVPRPKEPRLHHLVRYRPGDATPRDLGVVTIRNPDFTKFTDDTGKPLPRHGGFITLPDGTFTTRRVTIGICQAHDGRVYVLALQPYTLLQIDLPKD